MKWQPLYICDEENLRNDYCNATELGQFIVTQNATEMAENAIFTQAIHLNDPPPPLRYLIKKTGYYCVATSAFTRNDYSAIVEFRNAYGELPAAQIAKLPFYGGLTIAYAVIGAYVLYRIHFGYTANVKRFWAFFYVQHRHDIRKSKQK